MHERMPGSIAQASQGGTFPTKEIIVPAININTFKLKQPTLRWPQEEDRQEVKEKDSIERKEEGLLVKGMTDTEEREKYRLFLAYCEERRKEWRKQEEEDTTRKEMQRRKEEHWKLFRESISFLKENERHWQQRKIKEVDRIKEEEKTDRMAVCKQKKRRYGIQKMSKEENKRMKERTEERIIISQAKANYWKRHRGEESMTKSG